MQPKCESALPMAPNEQDRERFQDITNASGYALEYNRDSSGGYRCAATHMVWQIWWAQERERQMLQNLNMAQSVEIQRLLNRAERAEAELKAAREQEPVAEYDGVEMSRYTLRGIDDPQRLNSAAPAGRPLE